MSNKNKIAMITGATSGIGKAVALDLAENGFTVVVAGRSEDRLQRVADLIGNETLAIKLDVADPFSVQSAFEKIEEKFGRLDFLFNNAGTGLPGEVLFEDICPEDWETILKTNLSGVFFCTQNAFRLMKSQEPSGGRILNNGSVSSFSPRPNSAPYTATKHGVSGLTRSSALDGRRFNIAVGQIDIGNVASELTAGIADGMPQASGSYESEALMGMNSVVQAVRHIALLPLEANALFSTLHATQMPLVGRG